MPDPILGDRRSDIVRPRLGRARSKGVEFCILMAPVDVPDIVLESGGVPGLEELQHMPMLTVGLLEHLLHALSFTHGVAFADEGLFEVGDHCQQLIVPASVHIDVVEIHLHTVILVKHGLLDSDIHSLDQKFHPR